MRKNSKKINSENVSRFKVAVKEMTHKIATNFIDTFFVCTGLLYLVNFLGVSTRTYR